MRALHCETHQSDIKELRKKNNSRTLEATKSKILNVTFIQLKKKIKLTVSNGHTNTRELYLHFLTSI